MRGCRRILIGLAAIALLGALAALVFGVPVPIGENALFAPPPTRPGIAAWRAVPARDVDPFELRAADSVALRGWSVRGRKAAPWIIYFNGNASTAASSLRMLQLLAHGSGMTAVDVDYRGYGFSGGSTSLDRSREDALRTFDAVAARAGTSGVIVYGQSMGSIFATHVAAERPVRAIVLHSPLASVDIETAFLVSEAPGPLRRLLHPFPSASLQRGMDNLDEIARVHAPLLVIHGDRDHLVTYDGGVMVFERAGSRRKQFVRASGRDHSNIVFAGTPYGRALFAFFASVDPTRRARSR